MTETALVLTARLKRDARGVLSRFVTESGMVVIPFGDVHYGTAVDAWLRFGNGRHPAALNFGQCLPSAVARITERPLLCTGEDFARTDLLA